MPNPHITRAEMLLNQSRPDMAEAELRRGLVSAPEDWYAHTLLGMSLLHQDRTKEAHEALVEAIRLNPESYLPHYMLGLIYIDNDRLTDARRASDEALRLDPYQTCCYVLAARLQLKEDKREEALKTLNRGLALDPEDVSCLNLRAQILTHLGRAKEAQATIARTLAAAPEDADTHATQGWAMMHTNKPREALKHFEEALRIEPGHDYAKAGLVEALKARYLIYRLVLGFFLWIARLDRRSQMFLIVGAYVGYQLLRVNANLNASIRPVAHLLMGVYMVFVLLTWIAFPLFNLSLRLNPHGWNALNKRQKIATDGFGLIGGVGVGLAIAGYFMPQPELYLWAGYMGIMAIMFSRLAARDDLAERKVMLYAAVVAAFAGPFALICDELGFQRGPFFLLIFWGAVLVFVFGPAYQRVSKRG